MPPTSASALIELIRRSGLVEESQLDGRLDQLLAAGTLPTAPDHLAALLVRERILTEFQAELLLGGKWKGFCVGPYKLLGCLGAGLRYAVYSFEHLPSKRTVALKVLPSGRADDSVALERFHAEARILAAVDHPNIVRIYEVHEDAQLRFLALEHVEGGSLTALVNARGPLPAEIVVQYARQAVAGLVHAWERGIVHRDINPDHLLLDHAGTIKVIGFSLARTDRPESPPRTPSEWNDPRLGNPVYLAPELAQDVNHVDLRADVCSLGATLYFCLTGFSPCPEGTYLQKLLWVQTHSPMPILRLRPDAPEALVAAIERMMHRDPDRRYQSAHEVTEALGSARLIT